ncbi:MAG: flagellar assembly protein FliH [Gammaproteobacteria bacterium]|nr:MAG: flagellar assembly protein FliH [Gammaproteobacteria bacterium]
MDNQETWQRASLSTFELNKEGPYLDQELSVSNTQRSYEEKLKNGYEDGLKQGQQALNEYKQTFDSVFSSLDNALKEVDQNVIEAITQLAVSISKQIIRRELQINSEQVVSVVKEAIKLLPLDKGRLIIHLNPGDLNVVQKVFNQDDIVHSYSLVEDPSVQRGGCKLATDDSIIDATIDSQVAQISAKILGSQRTTDRSDE